MSLKKSLVFSVLGLGSLVCTDIYAYAYRAAPVNPYAFGPYVYIGGQVGYAHSDWSGFTDLGTADNDGVVYGGKLGYQATRRFGAEVGGFVLPKSDQSLLFSDGTFNSINGSVKSWVGYGAATFRFPLLKNETLYLRGKVGPAYRSLEHDGELYTGVGTGHYWTAILGASLNYAFTTQNPVIVGIEYSNIFGSKDSWSSNGAINANAAPSVQIVAATLSVAFKL